MANLVQLPKELKLTGNIAENWRVFKRQRQIYCDAVEIEKKTDKQQIAILLNIAGPEATDLYDSWETLTDPKLNDVEGKFKAHCVGTVNMIVYRYKFWARNQKEGETVNSYYQELRTLVTDCQYGDLKKDMLRDKICIIIRNDAIRERIFREKDPTLEKVLAPIESAETSRSNVQEVQALSGRQSESVKLAVNTVKRQDTRGSLKTNSSQDASNQSKKEYLCKKCNTKHGPRMCPAFGK